jgi:eukaryotic-like serine/threonine-protein kinase
MAPPCNGMRIAGKYRLERPLASGGMGTVWVARDEHLDRPVAIKLMAPELAASDTLRARFEREAKAAAGLSSNHVVRVYEHGVDDGLPFMAMELLDGEDFGSRLKREGRIDVAAAAAIATQVAKALRKAHEAGLVHRDLKPRNVFLARVDDNEVVKVLDFGIVKSAEPARPGEATKTGVIMGSPKYMSPEQVRSAKGVDHRSDLWSLGLILFRAVTGRSAFEGETPSTTVGTAPPVLRASIPAAGGAGGWGGRRLAMAGAVLAVGVVAVAVVGLRGGRSAQPSGGDVAPPVPTGAVLAAEPAVVASGAGPSAPAAPSASTPPGPSPSAAVPGTWGEADAGAPAAPHRAPPPVGSAPKLAGPRKPPDMMGF